MARIGLLAAMAARAKMVRAAKVRAVVAHAAKAKATRKLAQVYTRRAAVARKVAAAHLYAGAAKARSLR
jgi:hypothetical protein